MKTPKNPLINQELKNEFAKIGEQKDVIDPIIVATFFNPSGPEIWYAISYNEDKNVCYGYVSGFGCDEPGYFSIDELEALVIPPFGIRIARDLDFSSCPLSKITRK